MHLFRSRKSAVAPWPVPNMGSRPERDGQGVAKELQLRLRGLKGRVQGQSPLPIWGVIRGDLRVL